jgi:SAM-dependent methyltransferase
MLPDALVGISLGPRSTVALLERAPDLVALESDPSLVMHLRRRFGSAVEVVEGDATRMPFAPGAFSGVVCFTMLHHLADAEAQDRLFGEVARVLEPGGVFVARDSVGGWRFRLIHLGDTCTPLDPSHLRNRLIAAGFDVLEISAGPGSVQLKARRVAASQDRDS